MLPNWQTKPRTTNDYDITEMPQMVEYREWTVSEGRVCEVVVGPQLETCIVAKIDPLTVSIHTTDKPPLECDAFAGTFESMSDIASALQSYLDSGPKCFNDCCCTNTPFIKDGVTFNKTSFEFMFIRSASLDVSELAARLHTVNTTLNPFVRFTRVCVSPQKLLLECEPIQAAG